MLISQTGKLSLRKNRRLLSEVTKLNKRQGAVVSDSKAAFFPHHPASPLCPGCGQCAPFEHSTPQSKAVGISCQGSNSDPRPGSFLGCEAGSLFTRHRSGMAKSSVPVCLICLLLSLGPSVSQLWSNPRTVCAECTPAYREGV